MAARIAWILFLAAILEADGALVPGSLESNVIQQEQYNQGESSTDLELQLFEEPTKTVAERIRIVFKTKQLSDCTFIVGDKMEKILAHRIFLMIASPVFFSMLVKKTDKTSEIVVPDVTASGFNGLLEYFYTDGVTLDSVQHAFDVFDAAKRYRSPFLESKCLEYVQSHLTPKTCLKIYDMVTKELQSKALEDGCQTVFRKHTADVIGDESFMNATASTVKAIVEQDDLNVASEFVLFMKVKDWMTEESRRQGKSLKEAVKGMGEIIKHLRFLAMSPTEFQLGPANSDLLTADQTFAVFSWVLASNNELPESLSRVSQTRDNSRATGTLEFTVETSLVCKMAPGERMYSQPATIANVPWRIEISGNDTMYVSICTKDERKDIKKPSSARMRMVDVEGIVLYFSNGNRSNWEELTDSWHDEDSQLCLMFPYTIGIRTVSERYKIMKVEVVIEK